jgi:hypothetical protein
MARPQCEYSRFTEPSVDSGSFWEKNENQRTINFSYFKHLKELANFVKEPVKTQWGFMAHHFLILSKNLRIMIMNFKNCKI